MSAVDPMPPRRVRAATASIARVCRDVPAAATGSPQGPFDGRNARDTPYALPDTPGCQSSRQQERPYGRSTFFIPTSPGW